MTRRECHINLGELIIGNSLWTILSDTNLGIGTAIDAHQVLPIIGKSNPEDHVTGTVETGIVGREQLESCSYNRIIVLKLAR